MSSDDLISSLPEPIIHHCLSFLPTKDATRTSILSKKWKSICDSFPILNFDQALFEMSLPPSNYLRPLRLREMFLEYLFSSIQRRRQGNLIKLQKFRLVAHLRGSCQANDRLNTAINFAVESDVRELELAISFKVHEFFMPPKSLYWAKSVSVIKLGNLKVELHDLIQGCPSMEELRVQNCQVPQDIKVVSHNKLKILELSNCFDVKSLTMEEINLQSFIFIGGFKKCFLSITACKSLKNLSLQRILINYQWLEDAISKLIFLETLDLAFCIGLNRVTVCHQQLTSFKLCVCDEEEVPEIKIDSPKLRWFLYHGKPTRFGLFNSFGVLDAMLSLHKPNDIDPSQWFVNLIEFLLLFGHCKALKLMSDTQKDLISTEELKDRFLPPLCDLKNMKIEISDQDSVNYADLVDTLLWLSPHLERLSIVSGDRQISMKFEHEMDNEETFCCGAYPRECWKYYLKKVIVIFYSGINDDKEDLFAYFRQNAKAMESIDDNSMISLTLPEKKYVSEEWKEVYAGRYLSRTYLGRNP